MLFAFSIGSKGLTEECYSLHIPFTFSSGTKLNLEGTKFECEMGQFQFTIEQHHHLYSLKIFPFNSVEEAQIFKEKLIPSIHWVALTRKTGIEIPHQLEDVLLYEQAIAVSKKSNMYEIVHDNGWETIDGDYDVNSLVVIPEHKNLSCSEMGKASLTIGFGPDKFIEELNNALSFEDISEVAKNNKLCLAIQIYSSFSFEITDASKFIKLVTVLESLLPEERISDNENRILRMAKDTIKTERDAVRARGESVEEVNYLISRLGDLSKQPIGKCLAIYLKGISELIPSLEIDDELIRRIKRAYNIRSRLLHDGEFDEEELKQYLVLLSNFIPDLLLALFKVSAGEVEP